jgi:cellobiose phosphorylase
MGILANAYGSFSDDGREYLINRPDTPMPWINVISNGDYGLTISQAGSGYSWRTHASLNRLTRWEQDLIRDEWGKYLYIRDAATGEFWSVARQPCGEGLEDYQVRHGMGYSVIAARRGSLQSEVTYTVPLDAPCELWLLRLTNQGDKPRRLQVFSYFEWGLGAAPDWHREFHRIFIETGYEPERGVLLAGKVLWDLPGEEGPHWNRSWPYLAFHSASLKPAGFDSDKRAFLDRHGHLSHPHALQEGRSQGTTGRWGDPIGSLRVEIEIPPGASKELTFVLGAAGNREEALALAGRFSQSEAARQALAETSRFWQKLTGALQVETPDPTFNLMGNGWLAYQAISGRLWGRTAYYQTGGAYGYRDQLQDSLVWLLLGRPEKTLDQIRLHAAHQFQEGIVLHWWHPLAETGLPSKYSDDMLWLPFAVLYYINETGDTGCLQEEMPFYDGGAATLLEHCLRSFKKALSRRSPRGLPLILEADWNDGLNAVGAGGQGESIWMAHFLYYLLSRWALLPVLDSETVRRFQAEAVELEAAANTHGWDGEWYWRATTDQGKVLGASSCQEGKIFLTAPPWAVLRGLAPDGRANRAMAAAREHLFKQYGPLLLAPGYSIPDPSVGYLTRYAPGTRENGGVYVHAACWAVLAERQINGAGAAYRLWRSFCPAVRGEEPDIYMAEPYVMPGNVDGPTSEFPGRGGWTWYTGSAAWNLRAIVSGVLGLEATFEGLRLKAELPEDWPRYRVVRIYRGATYDITVRRGKTGEPKSRRVNGQAWAGDVLPLAPSGATQQVEVVI